MINILKIKHDYPEKNGFFLKRPQGHTNYIFLHFITPVDMWINDNFYKIKTGACILLTPNTPHFFKSTDNLLHNWFHADSSIQELIDTFSIPINEPFYPRETAFISELFYKIELEVLSTNQFKGVMIDALVTQFFCTLSRLINNTVPRIPQKNIDKLRLVRQKILIEPEKHHSINELAETCNLSPSRFHSVYKSVFGTSPIKDSIFARIEYAKDLLLNTDRSITEIAEMTGYTDQYHFIRQFKKETGLTPAKYKKEV
jgi:AraC family transcriptional regulator of arabinose operon